VPFAYYARLSAARKRIYDRSDAIERIDLPEDEGRQAVIKLWMRTAKNQRVVAFKSFVRTLLHELCHHLDYEFYKLEETFHTEGFYKRESSLFHQIAPKAHVSDV